MTVVVKNKLGLTVPETTLKQAGIRPGDLIAFTASKGAVTIRPVIDEKRFPLYTPTKAEAAAIRKGRAAYKRGDYITLNQLHDELDSARHQAGKKRARKVS
jgi:hypothetical protein